MKKNILLLVAPFLLCSCVMPAIEDPTDNPTQEETGGNQETEEGQETGGNQETEEGQETGGNQENPPVIEEEEGKTNPDNLQEYTKVVDFYGVQVATKFPNGTNFNASSTDKNKELKEYLDDQLEHYDLISGVSLDYCTTRKYQSETYFQLNTGKLGANEGYFKWNSDVKIYSIRITALNYANPYTDYATGQEVPNVEGNAKVFVNGSNEMNLTTSTGNFPVPTTLDKIDFDGGVNSFKVTATGGRVLIKSIEITWRG